MTAPQQKGLIFLDVGHPIIESTFRERLMPGAKLEPLDIKISDFDKVSYHVKVSKDTENLVQLTMNMGCLRDMQSSVKPLLRKKYAAYLKSDSTDKVTLEVDVKNPKTDKVEELVTLMGEVKRNILAAPFEEAFDALLNKSSSKLKPTVLNYRPKEQIVIQPSSDRINVFISLDFEEETDAAIADIMLQEFVDAKRSIPTAPNVSFSRDMPGELKKVKGIKSQSNEVGYLMFQIFEPHVNGEKKEKLISMLLMLRSYLHYHIKASKAQLHERMRNRVKELLQILNRARPENEERRVRAYRTFIG